jgi:hypothetical protein
MDGTTGRLMSNAGELAARLGITDENELANWKNPAWLESAISNSPVSRLLTTLRTMTDVRKLPGYEGENGVIGGDDPLMGLPLAGNLLTGMKVQDISQGAQDAQLQKLIDARLKSLGPAVSFTKVSIPEANRAGMNAASLQRLQELQQLEALLNDRKKKRKLQVF